MMIKRLIQGGFLTNTYVLSKDSDVIVIDPTGKVDSIVKAIGENKLKAIFLTHGHFDHIEAVDALVELYHCPVYLHHLDHDLMNNENYISMSRAFATMNTKPLDLKEGMLEVASFKIDVLHTPGHTEGSCIIIIDSHMFTGDTLFKGSIGRVDLYGGDYGKMLDSLKFIKTYKKDYEVHPGHDESTTLFKEFETNPYLRRL